MRVINRFTATFALFSVFMLIAACGGGGSSGGGGGSTAGTPAAGQGTIAVYLTDAPTTELKSVYVTVASVAVHLADTDQWQTIAEPNQTYDLLELLNGVTTLLGEANVAAGRYTQLRLLLSASPSGGHPFASYVIDLSDQAHELKVPSGYQSGIKLTHGFTVPEGGTVALVIDFDAAKSVKKTGNGQYQMKPTIRVSDAAQ